VRGQSLFYKDGLRVDVSRRAPGPHVRPKESPCIEKFLRGRPACATILLESPAGRRKRHACYAETV
jgi:hypothetical protein